MNFISLEGLKVFFTGRVWPGLHSLKPLGLEIEVTECTHFIKVTTKGCCWLPPSQVLGPSKLNCSSLCSCWSLTGREEDQSELRWLANVLGFAWLATVVTTISMQSIVYKFLCQQHSIFSRAVQSSRQWDCCICVIRLLNQVHQISIIMTLWMCKVCYLQTL